MRTINIEVVRGRSYENFSTRNYRAKVSRSMVSCHQFMHNNFQMVWIGQDESGLADIRDLEDKLKVHTAVPFSH